MMRAGLFLACIACATICSCASTSPTPPFLASWFMTEEDPPDEPAPSSAPRRLRSEIYVAILNRSDMDQQINAIALNQANHGAGQTGYWWKHLLQGPIEEKSCKHANPQILKPGGVFFRLASEFEDKSFVFPDCTVPVNVIVYRDIGSGGCERVSVSLLGLPSSAPHDWADHGCPNTPAQGRSKDKPKASTQ